MKLIHRSVIVLTLIALSLLTLVISSGLASASHCSCYHNAIDKKVVTNKGVEAEIEGTNPNLNGGAWTYVRAAAVYGNAVKYGEIGRLKRLIGETQTEFVVWVTWRNSVEEDGTSFSYGALQNNVFQVKPASSGSETWKFYMDGSEKISKDLDITGADFVACGGETSVGSEGMGNTRCGSGGSFGLLYRLEVSGSEVWYQWNGHESHVEQSPYQTVDINSNNFRVTGND